MKLSQSKPSAEPDPELEKFLDELEHPLKKELLSLRRVILDASPAIAEGFKWNSLSFRTREWFATINVTGGGRPPRPKDPPLLRLVLHAGAKARAKAGPKVKDPAKLLAWLAKDRCMVTFASDKELRARSAALQAILREWIGQL